MITAAITQISTPARMIQTINMGKANINHSPLIGKRLSAVINARDSWALVGKNAR
jgi:hypothetical protein